MSFAEILEQALSDIEIVNEWRNVEDETLSVIIDRAATGEIGSAEVEMIRNWVLSQKPELGETENELVLNKVVNNIRESLVSAMAKYKKTQEGSILQHWALETTQSIA
jgi:hypothetical protein